MDDVIDDLLYHVRRGNNNKATKIIDEHNLHPNEEILSISYADNGSTIMHMTAEFDNIKLFKQLTRRGGSPYVVNGKAEGLLHLAAREGHVDFMQHLLENYDMDIDQIMNDHWTPLCKLLITFHMILIYSLCMTKQPFKCKS